MSGKTVRKSNIELLRALLMFMVIVLHYNNEQMGGGFGYATGISLLSFIPRCWKMACLSLAGQQSGLVWGRLQCQEAGPVIRLSTLSCFI